MNVQEQAQAKRERRANRKDASNYAKFNITNEGQAQRDDANEKIEAYRARCEARRIMRDQLVAQREPHVHDGECDHEHDYTVIEDNPPEPPEPEVLEIEDEPEAIESE